jgi:hypothetical protein
MLFPFTIYHSPFTLLTDLQKIYICPLVTVSPVLLLWRIFPN